MPSLYGFTSNSSNVSVTNTTGLYQMTGNVTIFNSAQSLYALLANSASIGFELVNNNSDVTAIVLPSGVTSGTYGNGTVVPIITVGADGRVTSIVNIPINSPGTYSNANVSAYLPINSSNVAGNYFTGNGSLLTGISVSSNIILTGDITGTGNTGNAVVTTLNNIGVAAGSYGSNLVIPVVTVAANGRVTSISSITAANNFGNVVANYAQPAQFAVTISANNQSFTNATLANYTSNTQITVFHNGVLIPYGDYSLAGSTITINEFLTAGDTINIAPQVVVTNATGTYSNTNVTALLSAGISSNINVNAGSYFIGNGSLLTGITGTYSNANVASYMPVFGGNILAGNISNTGNVTVSGNLAVNTLATVANIQSTNGYFWANGTAYSTGSGSSGVSQIIAGANITISPVGGTGIVTITANTQAGTYGNSNVAAYLIVNPQSGTYSNTNVSAYLTTATISTTGNITGGNITTTGTANVGIIQSTNGYFWANGTAYSTGSGSSGVSQIVAGSNITISPVGGTGVVTITANVVAGTYGNTNVSAYLTTATISTTGNITGGNITTTGTANVGIIQSTNGYFWSNGTAYSSGGSTGPAGPAFSGNLAGNVLYDGTSGRVMIQASPLSPLPYNIPGSIFYYPTSPSGSISGNAALYSGNVITQLAVSTNSNSTIISATTANVAVQSSYQAATNRTLTGQFNALQVVPVTANIMQATDRIRAATTIMEIDNPGYRWGTMNSTAQGSITTTAAIFQHVHVGTAGNSEISSQTAVQCGISNSPTSTGSANVQYQNGMFVNLGYNTVSPTSTRLASNINIARMVSGSLQGAGTTSGVTGGNLWVDKVIGLHTYNGWAANVTSIGVGGRYAVLNEDANTVIQTNGLLFTSGNLQLGGYLPAKQYNTGSSSYNVGNVNQSTYAPFQQFQLTSNSSVTVGYTGQDVIYDMTFGQDSTGGRIVTFYNSDGNTTNTNQIFGFISPLPNATTLARVIQPSAAGVSSPFVQFSNPSALVLTVAQALAYTGAIGQYVAISNGTGKNGGQLAYWDTTNSRWSWVDTNLAVS